jgi:exodeoxyribonuclease VII large subunit
LSDRAARASQAFQARSGRLSLPLLRQRIAAGQERLARSGLDRRLIDRRLDAATRALSAAHRLHLSVDPERPLALGYAMVRNGAGAPVTTRDAAAGEALLELTFRDGALQVAPADGSPPANPPARPAKRPARRKTPPAAPDAQPKLL